MEEWKQYRLGDIISISSGLAYKGEHLGKGDSFLLGMGCVSYTEQFLEKGMRKYDGAYDERYSLKAGDIVLATRQQSDNLPILGMPAIIPQKFHNQKMVFGTNLYKVNLNSPDFSNSFLYWLLKTPNYIHHIKSCQTGTTVRMITKANIEDYTFFCPEKSEREKICKFLWNIENKIALNRRINDNLEQQAQALFKSWFVDFEPFKEGKFVDSEMGMIPEGWKVGRLCDFAIITMGQSPSGDSYNENKEGMVFYQGRSEFGNRFPSIKLYTTDPNRIAEKNSILISVRAPVGDINIASQDCCIGRGLASIKARGNYNSFLYYTVKSMKKEFDVYNGEGTVFGSINKDSLNSMPVIIPTTEEISNFEKITSVLDYNYEKCHRENIILTSLRDNLLPRLISGGLKINDLNC